MNVPNHEKKAFRDMTPEERSAIVEAVINRNGEYWNGQRWGENELGAVFADSIYRTRPRQLVIPWEHIKPEYKWARLNECGEVWFYTFIPDSESEFWGDARNYCRSPLSIDTTGIDWRESLTARPEGV